MKRSGKASNASPDDQAGASKGNCLRLPPTKKPKTAASESSKGKESARTPPAGDVKESDALAWLNNEAAVREWMSKYDLPKLLDKGKVHPHVLTEATFSPRIN